MEPFGYESGPSRAMQTFKEHEESYHRCSVAINRGINGLQRTLSYVEAVGASELESHLREADQHVGILPRGRSTSVDSHHSYEKCLPMEAWAWFVGQQYCGN